jgi:hypothetical protein
MEAGKHMKFKVANEVFCTAGTGLVDCGHTSFEL